MTYPHCDMNVLHAPGECVYCDMHPDTQAARTATGVNFTGHGADPATAVRPLETINRWYGNVPKTQEDIDEDQRFWDEMRENAR